jgi:hypothetical protein
VAVYAAAKVYRINWQFFWLPADLERSVDSIHSHSAMLKKLVWFPEVGLLLMMAVPDLVVISGVNIFLNILALTKRDALTKIERGNCRVDRRLFSTQFNLII